METRTEQTAEQNISLLFVCQPGRMELLARVLVASVRYYESRHTQLVACIPEGSAPLSYNTLSVFDDYAVDIRHFTPVLKEKFNYPIGNKLDALAQCGSANENGISVIMDTDIISLSRFDIHNLLAEVDLSDVAAAPIFGAQVFTLENRKYFDELCGRLRISGRLALSPMPKRKHLEAFNAGFVVTSSNAARTRWYQLTEQILEDTLVPEKFRFPFADQVSLAILRADLASRFTTLDSKWNRGHVSLKNIPYFFHYHSFGVLLRHRFTNQFLRKIILSSKSHNTHLLGELALRDLFYFLEEKTIVSDDLHH
jgi:hypothetical protein